MMSSSRLKIAPLQPSRRNVLLAGAAGFIGSSLSERLLAEGFRVIGVDNFITGRRSNLTQLRREPRFELIEADVGRPLQIDTDLDWVLHFASPASPPKYLRHPLQTLLANSRGSHELLDLAQAKRAQFFLASTSEVYGDARQHPQSEDYWGNVNPIGSRSIYDEGKRYAEALTMLYRRKQGQSVRIARIFNTYGPRMDPYDGRVVSNFIRQALLHEPITVYGDGTQTRSLQYIDDLVEAIVRLMHSDYQMPINLGNPEELSILELARMVQELTDNRSPIAFAPLPDDDPCRRRPDIRLARRELGWQPRVPASEGVQNVVDYFTRTLDRFATQAQS